LARAIGAILQRFATGQKEESMRRACVQHAERARVDLRIVQYA
jgi:hypothetical protein